MLERQRRRRERKQRPAKQAGVIAFEKFATSPSIELKRTLRNRRLLACQDQPHAAARSRPLEPVTYKLVTASDHVKYHYEHAKFATLQPFTDAWKNYWPAYVQGSIDTKTFLNRHRGGRKGNRR